MARTTINYHWKDESHADTRDNVSTIPLLIQEMMLIGFLLRDSLACDVAKPNGHIILLLFEIQNNN